MQQQLQLVLAYVLASVFFSTQVSLYLRTPEQNYPQTQSITRMGCTLPTFFHFKNVLVSLLNFFPPQKSLFQKQTQHGTVNPI